MEGTEKRIEKGFPQRVRRVAGGGCASGTMLVKRRVHRSAAGFDFYDLHVQGSPVADAAPRALLCQEERFWIAVHVRHWNTRRGRIVVNCTLAGSDGEQVHRAASILLHVVDGVAFAAIGPTSITLPDGVAARTYTIRVSATLNGVTQTRTMRLSVFS